jgi:peptidylprolyl isomerase domain and WD repeat-containing protein 1
MYEKSYMHRDTVTHVAFASPGSAGGGGGGGGGGAAVGGGATAASSSTSSTFLITASADGVVKFWSKKRSSGNITGGGVVEFAKQYAAHSGPVLALPVSADGCLAATVSAADGTAKVFDVASFDMTAVIRLPFAPSSAVDWISPPGARGAGSALLAVADSASGGVSVFDAASEEAAAAGGVARPLWHFASPLGSPSSPVTCLRYNSWADCLVASDSRGMLDYFRAGKGERREGGEGEGEGGGEEGRGAGNGDGERDDRPLLEPRGLASWPAKPCTSFSLKSDSDLYALAKAKTRALSLEVSPDGRRFVACCLDGRVRVFDFRSGKLLRCYDESPDAAAEMQRAASDALAAKVDKIMEQREAVAKGAAPAAASGEGRSRDKRDLEQLTSDALTAASASSTALEPIDFGRRLAAERELSLLLLSSGAGAGGGGGGAAAADAPPPSGAAASTAAPAPVPQPAFDASGHFLAYGSLFGIKVVNLETNRLVRLLGKVESSERFLRLSLFQGAGGGGGGAATGGGSRAAARAAALAAGDDDDDDGDDGDDDNGDKSKTKKKKRASASSCLLGDPTLAATAVGRARFFLFTSREPEDPEAAAARAAEAASAALSRGGAAAAAAAVAAAASVGRDVLNEKPRPEDLIALGGGEGGAEGGDGDGDDVALPACAVLRTTAGDITLRLFPEHAPKAVENFTTHGRNGYYDNLTFHRVIKGFMIQGECFFFSFFQVFCFRFFLSREV